VAPINAADLNIRLQKGEGVNLLDVREEIEYATYNIGGQNIPLSKLPAYLDQLNYNKTDEIVVICKIGLRSQTATTILNQNGYQNARNLAGGLIALQKLNTNKTNQYNG
jgi:rhodanese-related sulfurtransferase